MGWLKNLGIAAFGITAGVVIAYGTYGPGLQSPFKSAKAGDDKAGVVKSIDNEKGWFGKTTRYFGGKVIDFGESIAYLSSESEKDEPTSRILCTAKDHVVKLTDSNTGNVVKDKKVTINYYAPDNFFPNGSYSIVDGSTVWYYGDSNSNGKLDFIQREVDGKKDFTFSSLDSNRSSLEDTLFANSESNWFMVQDVTHKSLTSQLNHGSNVYVPLKNSFEAGEGVDYSTIENNSINDPAKRTGLLGFVHDKADATWNHLGHLFSRAPQKVEEISEIEPEVKIEAEPVSNILYSETAVIPEIVDINGTVSKEALVTVNFYRPDSYFKEGSYGIVHGNTAWYYGDSNGDGDLDFIQKEVDGKADRHTTFSSLDSIVSGPERALFANSSNNWIFVRDTVNKGFARQLNHGVLAEYIVPPKSSFGKNADVYEAILPVDGSDILPAPKDYNEGDLNLNGPSGIAFNPNAALLSYAIKKNQNVLPRELGTYLGSQPLHVDLRSQGRPIVADAKYYDFNSDGLADSVIIDQRYGRVTDIQLDQSSPAYDTLKKNIGNRLIPLYLHKK